MKEIKKIYLVVALLISIGISLGVCGTLCYQQLINERTLNGIYIKQNVSYSTANEIAITRDKKGDWVCINVAYDMPPGLAYETCVHECSHKAFSEIFADRCEKNPEKCDEIIGGTNA